MNRIKHAQSVMIEGLDKEFVISAEYDGSNSMVAGMLIYDFKNQTWESKATNWAEWSMGVVNHLALDNSSSGYILGFSGHSRQVCTPWDSYSSNHSCSILLCLREAEWT